MTDQTLIARIRDLSTPLEPKPTGMEPWLEPLQGIKAVLFDVYGTLLISASGDIGLGGNPSGSIGLPALLANAGINADTRPSRSGIQQQLRAPIGERLSAAIRADHADARASGKLYPEVDIRAIWATLLAEHGYQATPQQLERIAVEYECRINPVWPMPGLADLLGALRQRGLLLGIVSNAQFYTPLILEAVLGQAPAELGLEPSCSAWSYQLREAKPSTIIYQVALDGLARKHGIPPEQVLYIGNDRRNDIWPAQQLGLKTALFAGDARSLRLREDDPKLIGVSADRVMTQLDQVEQIV
ncbi:MAG: HAD family hydrolase [Lamprobacter sp.]|uniref:HAD family hydrolase n=1 Tax=Lamprobacter sp. TaxID=3100796 RepID=UPI002B25E8F4|nr:HAD family hydrolase [Lamprobacter sp.]MEA3640626.1 HAD family hydrolase [Lamprobacter sp.]